MPSPEMPDQKQLPGFVCSPAAWIPPLLRHSPASGAAWGSQPLACRACTEQTSEGTLADRNYNAECSSEVSQIWWGAGAEQWTEPLALPATAHWSSQGPPAAGQLPGGAEPNRDLHRPQPGPQSLPSPCSPGCGHTPLRGPAAELLHGVGFPAQPTACLVCLLPPAPWTHAI